MISTGLPDIMMPVVSLADLAALTPDMPALAALSDRYKVTGVHAFTLDKADETDDALCHARNSHRSTISMKKPQPAPPTAP